MKIEINTAPDIVLNKIRKDEVEILTEEPIICFPCCFICFADPAHEKLKKDLKAIRISKAQIAKMGDEQKKSAIQQQIAKTEEILKEWETDCLQQEPLIRNIRANIRTDHFKRKIALYET